MQTRPASFSDHYSQARQFFISQAPIEQKHIGDALVFELSKCERIDIREKMVGHLLNIDETLAKVVATGLGLKSMPAAARRRPADPDRSAALGRAQHRQEQRRRVHRPQARHSGERRLAGQGGQGPGRRCGEHRRGVRDRCPAHRRRGARRWDHGRSQAEDRWRPLGALRRHRRGAVRRRGEKARPRTRRPWTSSATPSPTASSSATRSRRASCSRRRGSRRPTTASCCWREAADAATFLAACGQLRLWDRELKMDLDAVAFGAGQAGESA